MRFNEELNLYITDDGTTYSPNEVIYSEIQEKHILLQWAVFTTDGKVLSQRELRNTVGYIQLSRVAFSLDDFQKYKLKGKIKEEATIDNYSDGIASPNSEVVHTNDGVWCFKNQATYVERLDKYYFDEDNIPTKHKISYYHHTSGDTQDLSGDSKYKVGYEIEKHSFTKKEGGEVRNSGDKIHLHDVFRGYETDSSCGVEAITNILPLTKDTKNVFKMFDDAENIINSKITDRCGGHINISIKGEDDDEILAEMMLKKMGFVYPLFPERLLNYQPSSIREGWSHSRTILTARGGRVEMRLPGAIENIEDLKWRHKFMYHWIDAMYNKETDAQTTLRLKPLYVERFGEEAKDKMNQALSFQKYIADKSYRDDAIRMFVDSKARKEELERLRTIRLEEERQRRLLELQALKVFILDGMRKRTVKIGRKTTTTLNGVKHTLELRPDGIYHIGKYGSADTRLDVKIFNKSVKSNKGITGVAEDNVEVNWKKNSEGVWEAHAKRGCKRTNTITITSHGWSFKGKVNNGLLTLHVGNRNNATFSILEGDIVQVYTGYRDDLNDYREEDKVVQGYASYLLYRIKGGKLVKPSKIEVPEAVNMAKFLLKNGFTYQSFNDVYGSNKTRIREAMVRLELEANITEENN